MDRVKIQRFQLYHVSAELLFFSCRAYDNNVPNKPSIYSNTDTAIQQ